MSAYALVFDQDEIRQEKSACYAYDLNNGKDMESLKFPAFPMNTKQAEVIFGSIAKKYPPQVVKCFAFVFPAQPPKDFTKDFETEWYFMVIQVGKSFGYENMRLIPENCYLCTSAMSNKSVKFEVNDKVSLTKLVEGPAFEIVLLVKKQIGWQISKIAVRKWQKSPQLSLKLLWRDLGVDKKDVKSSFFHYERSRKIFPWKDLCQNHELFSQMMKDPQVNSKLYYAKVFSGPEYFNDLESYVIPINLHKYELRCGKEKILLPFQNKPLPCFFSTKVERKNGESLDVVFSENGMDKSTVIALHKPKIKGKMVFVGFLDCNGRHSFNLIEDDGEDVYLASVCPIEQCYPCFNFTDKKCIIMFYKNAILQKFEDVNGNSEIPTAVSFGRKLPLFGSAALDDVKNVANLDFPRILDKNLFKEMVTKTGRIKMDNGKKRPILMVRTLQGWKKTDPESMFVFYLKSLIRLVEEKTGEKVMGIFVKLADFDEKANGWIHGSDTMKRVEKSLGVEVVVNAINNSDDKFLEVSEGGVELVKVL